ncbi:hypothetical protein HMI54_014537 [Coelomomyces lativittatus]|nr:hypothetical protein HMI55_007073 [Coelomomyces lativittatus]KAJ1510709.1 hypothetical protein HMI56_006210 [Coelomomyces lativittatus]KAJ1514033.1 hypothetical protein HMI54_014537 [Coelomomyces lativittatus]
MESNTSNLESYQNMDSTVKKLSITWKDMHASSFMIYGSIFVFSVESLLYPFDLIRTQMQGDTVMSGHGIRQMIIKNVKQGGWLQLYKGILPAMTVGFPAQGTYYLSYEYSRFKYEQWTRHVFGTFLPYHEFLCHALAGCTAEIASAMLYLPADTVTQRLQCQPKFNFFYREFQYRGALDVIRSIYVHRGIFGFYRGLVPHLVAYVPGSGVYWGVYEWMKGWMGSQDAWVASACAGTASVCTSNPLDVIRTRMQTDPRTSSMRAMAKELIKEEGWNGFLKGLKPRLMTSVPGSIVALSGYEMIKKWSQKKEENS